MSSLRETHKPRCGNKYPRRERVPAETTMPQVLGDTTRAPAPRHIFAIVCCVRSTKVQTSLNETSLYRTLYPSLRDTVTPRERKLWRVRLYLCADDDDQLCSSSTLRRWRPTLRSASRRRSSSFRRAPTECPVARRRSRRASTALSTSIEPTTTSATCLPDGSRPRCARSAGSSRQISAWPAPRSTATAAITRCTAGLRRDYDRRRTRHTPPHLQRVLPATARQLVH